MNNQNSIVTNILALAQRSTWQDSVDLADEAFLAWLGRPQPQEFERICFVGCGTSLYAGQVGKYVVERLAQIPAEAWQAFAFATYAEPAILGPQTLVVGISTTGETEAVYDAISRAKEAGAPTLAVTAHANSKITQVADAIALTGGHDDIVPHKTKSYVQSLITIYVLALHLAQVRTQDSADVVSYWRGQISRAADSAIRFLEQGQPQIERLAQEYAQIAKAFVLGAGPNGGTAQEASLKIIEMANLYSEAQELEDFMHGRFNEVDQVNPMFMVAPHGRASQRILDFLTVTDHIDAPTVVLTDHITSGMQRLGTHIIHLPNKLEELATPLLYIVPLYLFASHIAVQRGLDPAARRYDMVAQKFRFVDIVDA